MAQGNNKFHISNLLRGRPLTLTKPTGVTWGLVDWAYSMIFQCLDCRYMTLLLCRVLILHPRQCLKAIIVQARWLRLPSDAGYMPWHDELHNNWTVTIDLCLILDLIGFPHKNEMLYKMTLVHLEFIWLVFIAIIWIIQAPNGLKWARLHSIKICYDFLLGKWGTHLVKHAFTGEARLDPFQNFFLVFQD